MDREILRLNLQKEKQELETRLDKIEKDFANRHISKQFDEQSVERENDQVLVNLQLEAHEELKLIELALARIDTDRYDKCTTCGVQIDEARLKAIPHSITCTSCAV